MPENTRVFQHFCAFCSRGFWPPSEHTTLDSGKHDLETSSLTPGSPFVPNHKVTIATLWNHRASSEIATKSPLNLWKGGSISQLKSQWFESLRFQIASGLAIWVSKFGHMLGRLRHVNRLVSHVSFEAGLGRPRVVENGCSPTVTPFNRNWRQEEHLRLTSDTKVLQI